MNLQLEQVRAMTRRHFFGSSGLGIGSMALASLMGGQAIAENETAKTSANPLAPKKPMFDAKAKAVIYLHMAGSPSQLELFEHKPDLAKLHGKPCPMEYLEGRRFAFIRGVPTMMGPVFKYGQHGQSGQWISELLPKFASVIDDVCVIRSMFTDQFNHAPAQIFFNTGSPRLGRPSMGSWVTYGLGSEAEDMPGFVVLSSGAGVSGGAANWGCGFMPSAYQGVPFRAEGDPILNLSNPKGFDDALQRSTLDLVRSLNEHRSDLTNDPGIASRIQAYELAYKMQ
ncbi:MAG: DUF1501 domain-containing protein, partial [Planctomycetes bacterium]|nr:DUF1501 domain-containing protein [Planctomycetota bacterium]